MQILCPRREKINKNIDKVAQLIYTLIGKMNNWEASMPEVKWTKEQQDAISKKDSNILVAAAAGSGKTAVLVERIIKKNNRR